VTVTITARARTITRRVRIANRRFNARIKLPSSTWRSAKVTVRYSAGTTRRAQTVTRTVRQRVR
jgi:hypothetical protein